jgi:hypothetical protein
VSPLTSLSNPSAPEPQKRFISRRINSDFFFAAALSKTAQFSPLTTLPTDPPFTSSLRGALGARKDRLRLLNRPQPVEPAIEGGVGEALLEIRRIYVMIRRYSKAFADFST